MQRLNNSLAVDSIALNLSVLGNQNVKTDRAKKIDPKDLEGLACLRCGYLV